MGCNMVLSLLMEFFVLSLALQLALRFLTSSHVMKTKRDIHIWLPAFLLSIQLVICRNIIMPHAVLHLNNLYDGYTAEEIHQLGCIHG